jgi:arylsulfatase A-like enzyme
MKKISRRGFLGAVGAGAAAAALSRGVRAAPVPAGRPNVVFIVTDDQRYGTIGALGGEPVKTPALDSLVRQGTAFTNPYIMGGTGGAICISSRAMFLTGRSLWHAPNDCGDFPLWPQVIRDAGYETYGIGKWHNGAASYARCFTGGANIFFGGMSNHLKMPVQDFDPSGKYPKTAEREGGKFSSELFADSAVEFLRRRKDEKPFFLYLAFTAPHDPRMAPEPYASMYPPDGIPLPKNFMPEHPFDNGELRGRDENLAPHPRTPEVVRRHIADYYGMITHMDAQIGRVLAAVDETGRARDTIVVMAGDNGLALGQHGLFGKQNVYEHSVRVPLVMRGPGVPAGEKRDAFVYLHDVFPTVCEMTGVPVPETVEGKSLAGVVAGRAKAVRDGVFAAFRNLQRMVRDERYKLIRYTVGGETRTQLFDLQADPWELADLSADAGSATHLAALEARLKAWQKEAGDPLAS